MSEPKKAAIQISLSSIGAIAARTTLFVGGFLASVVIGFAAYCASMYSMMYREAYQYKTDEFKALINSAVELNDAVLINSTNAVPLIDTSDFPTVTFFMLDRFEKGEMWPLTWAALAFYIAFCVIRWIASYIPQLKHQPTPKGS